MTSGFLFGSKNFCKLLWVSCEVLFLHGYAWIHWVARSCTTTAYRWLFRDSQFSLRTFWSAVIKSPKFFCTKYGSANASSARSPCDFGPRIFGLSGSECKHCVCPNPHFSWPLKIIHEKNLRVSLFVQELFHPQDSLWILAAIPVCRNNTGLPVLARDPDFIWFSDFGWFSQQLFWRFRRVRVSPFLPFHTFAWHDCWRVIWMINFLPWRCHGCWRRQAWGRTRWQAWNHDRNKVLRVAGYPNPVLNEMWFLTVDPFIRIFVIIAKLSKQQYCWRVIEDFHGQEYIQFLDIHCSLFMRLHFSIGGYDYRRTTRFRQGIHFSQVLFADHMHRRSRVHNKFSFLRFKSWCRQAPIFPKVRRMQFCFSPSIFIHFRPASTLLRGHLALALCLLLRPILKFWSVGATLMRFTWANHSERRIAALNFSSTCLDVGLASACLCSSGE